MKQTKTSNFEHRTSNSEVAEVAPFNSMFDVFRLRSRGNLEEVVAKPQAGGRDTTSSRFFEIVNAQKFIRALFKQNSPAVMDRRHTITP